MKAIQLNLAEKDSIEADLDDAADRWRAARLRGVADGTPGIERIDSRPPPPDRAPIGKGLLVRGGTISFILGGGARLGEGFNDLKELLETPTSTPRPPRSRGTSMANYYWMKQAVFAYVASPAFPIEAGHSHRRDLPGPTDTPLAQANEDAWLGFGADFRREVGIHASTPMEQAYPLLFLCSAAAASYQRHHADHRLGFMRAGITSVTDATPIAKFLMGRT